MLECLIIGDSIANGIKSVMRDCIGMTEIGISSETWNKKNHNRPLFDMEDYRYTVISLGTNDPNEDGGVWMRKARSRIKSGQVIWVLPSEDLKPKHREAVQRVAKENGDLVLSIRTWVGTDGIHPPTVRAYEQIGNVIKGVMK